MSNSYTQWQQDNGLYSQQPQDFDIYNTNNRQQQPQIQPQPPSTFSAPSFQFSQDPFASANAQQTQQVQRAQSLGSSNPPSQNGGYPQAVFHPTQPQFTQPLSVNTSSYRPQDPQYTPSVNLPANLTTSPVPMQVHFSQQNATGLEVQPQGGYYRPTPVVSGNFGARSKRHRLPDPPTDDDQDGDLSPEKEGGKKPCVFTFDRIQSKHLIVL